MTSPSQIFPPTFSATSVLPDTRFFARLHWLCFVDRPPQAPARDKLCSHVCSAGPKYVFDSIAASFQTFFYDMQRVAGVWLNSKLYGHRRFAPSRCES
jgi:hypothetical protein